MTELILRARRYFKRHGLRGVVPRIAEVMRDQIVPPNYILYYADLRDLPEAPPDLQHRLAIECFKNEGELLPADLEQIVAHRYTEVESEKISKRFALGACLWVLRRDGVILGFVWSIESKPIRPYFFPLTRGDVHVFDNEVFVEYRGQGFNPILINTVLATLRRERMARAFIETLERNTAERKSLTKTGFQQIARVRKRQDRRRTVVTWT
jgi:ribosomal protein S18 acetylase RimI-like enzyme